MAPLIPRLHLLEINDQAWFPDFLRARVQACLTLLWTFRVPVLQPCSPASLVAQTLLRLLGSKSAKYVYVDFCSGAGGPTLAIEREFNARLAVGTPEPSVDGTSVHSNGCDVNSGSGHDAQAEQAYFVLTDIAPHFSAWDLASKESPGIRYVPLSIDAAAASPSLLNAVEPIPLPDTAANLPVFRLFSLAFHHFNDTDAERILANTIETSSGFAILELQGRDMKSQIMTILLFPLLLIITPIFFWNDPIHLLFTYLLPIVPFVVAVDGMISSVRTRTGEEVKAMVKKVIKQQGGDVDEWDVIWGSEWHTWPIGEMTWVAGIRKGEHKTFSEKF